MKTPKVWVGASMGGLKNGVVCALPGHHLSGVFWSSEMDWETSGKNRGRMGPQWDLKVRAVLVRVGQRTPLKSLKPLPDGREMRSEQQLVRHWILDRNSVISGRVLYSKHE